MHKRIRPVIDPGQLKPSTNNLSKTRLLDAALHLIRAKGYAATAVDEICLQAGVTKGSFFHHFKSKDDLALAAVACWQEKTEGIFAAASYHEAKDPLDRLLGYLDLRAALLTGKLADYTCLLGTLLQETHATHPAIRVACERALSAHIAELSRDIAAAKRLYAPRATWSAQSVGNFKHLTRYLRLLFQPEKDSGPEDARKFDLQAARDSDPEPEPDEENAPLQSHFVD
jgi:TetR/AcrR family transcriptional repressor of nem operon